MDDTDKNKDSSKSDDGEWNSPPPGESKGNGLFEPLPAEYLLERGYCCGNGCKNCPYDYKAVPEPRRTMLLEQRKNNTNPNELHE